MNDDKDGRGATITLTHTHIIYFLLYQILTKRRNNEPCNHLTPSEIKDADVEVEDDKIRR
jgi:predicted transcriptional regulator